jgi:CHAT domain-containing protein
MKPLFVSETDASEAFFKSLSASLKGDRKKSPRFLHLATHGFFFTDPAGMGNPDAGVRKSETVFQISAHPMIRSGLILSGGNFAWQNGKAALPGLEDGILTAYEISQMDLSDTELVVLSACETGLGDIRGNEGVYGLQRAFKIAGAKYVIMSLWEVPDDLTKKLMAEYFYPNLLKNKMPIREAFYAAQKTMREIGFAPHQWAGFVLIE